MCDSMDFITGYLRGKEDGVLEGKKEVLTWLVENNISRDIDGCLIIEGDTMATKLKEVSQLN